MTTVAEGRDDGSADSPSEEESPPAAGPPETSAQARVPGAGGAPTARGATRQESGAESATPETAALPRVLTIIGSVVAPTTLLTALMVYFGYLEAAAFSWYLGVQVTVLDPTVQDYLITSANSLIPPLIAVAGAVLVALWVHQLLLPALAARTRRIVLRVLMPITAVAGLILLGLTVPVFPAFPEARGLSLALGVLLLTYAARLLRLLLAQRRSERLPRHVPGAVAVVEAGAAFILVSVGLFWAVGSYAVGVGTGRAQLLEASLPRYPEAVVYSETRLGLQGPGLQEQICQYPDVVYRFRYGGLKLVRQSASQYLFLPAGWTPANGAAVLMPRSDTLRLEFSPPGQVQNPTC